MHRTASALQRISPTQQSGLPVPRVSEHALSIRSRFVVMAGSATKEQSLFGHRLPRGPGRRGRGHSIAEHFLRYTFFQLQDKYTSKKNLDGTETIITDQPSTYMYFRMGKMEKEVLDYFGAPEELVSLESAIDKAAGTQRWVFVDAATIRSWADSGWSARKKGNEYLVDAVRWHDEEGVRTLLDLGTDPNLPQKSGATALVAAAACGYKDLLELLA